MSARLLSLVSGFWLLASAAQASFSPNLIYIHPRGAPRGSELTINLHGDRLDASQEILLHQPGIEVLALDAKGPTHVVAKIRIAQDAPLGEHPLRLRTTGGLSDLRTFWIGQFPTIHEKEDNNDFDAPQKVALNVTVQGAAKVEDEDFYSVTLKKGQSLSVEVEAMRLGRTFFDTYVAILDPNRFELASCDDASLLYTDACASIVAPQDGEYRILVREAAYQGSNTSRYRLHIGTFPRPTAVFPTGARPGETIDFRFIGDPAGDITRSIAIPPDAAGRFPVFAERDGLLSPSPNWIEVSPLASINEQEPNDNQKQANQAPDIPCAIHGILSKKAESDWFRFTAKKNENLEFRVLGRHLRSPIDSVLILRDPKNKGLANNDDQGGPDSILSWKCPADGEYTISVRDKLERHGPDFTYRLEISRRQPSLTGTLPVFERNKSQLRKTISVPRGNRYATVVNLARKNTGCEVAFTADSLPPGVTLNAPAAPKSVTSFPAVFTATADAPHSGAFHSFKFRSTADKENLSGPLKEMVHHIEINNQGPYHSTISDKIAVAVIDEAPYHIDLDVPAAPIVRGGTMKLKLRAKRKEGFEKPITLRFLWKPPGIGAPVTIKMEGEEADYEVNANGEAAIGEWKIAVIGDSTTDAGLVSVSTDLVSLKIAEPYLTGSIDMVATEQSRDVPILCKMEYASPFSGNASAELVGLPHGVTADPVEFAHGSEQLTFPLKVAADAAVGKHSGLFLRIHVPENGTTVLHQTAKGGTLRIDKPAPKVVAKETSKTPKKPKPAAAAKPLSRLEQLRQEAK